MRGTIPDWMIIDACRYCYGRKTLQVSTTVKWLLDNWPKLTEYTKGIIKMDLEREFEYEAKTPGWLGHDCDRQQWERVRSLWRV